MENEMIMIKCPNDGSLLKVKYVEGIESKMVKCPCCGRKMPFTDFIRVKAKEPEKTEYPDGGHKIERAENLKIGRLVSLDGKSTFQLRAGQTVVGRRSAQSKADYQLPCESRRMSREHLLVEVKRVEGKGFVHYLSLYKEKVNPTYVGQVQLLAGDRVVLHHGDVVRLPDAAIRFELSDDDKTNI